MKEKKRIVLLLLIYILVVSISGCAPQKEQKHYSSQKFLMDTVINIEAYGEDEKQLKKVVESAYTEMSKIASLTDRFPKPDTTAYEASDICKVNAEAGKSPVKVSEDVYKMIELSLYYSKISEDAFDITIGPLMDLWGFSNNSPQVPSDAQIKKKLQLVDSSQVILDKEKRTVFLNKSEMSIDLGAIAKGYAAEKAAQVLRKAGVKQALINAGGNVVVIGMKDGKNPWKVGIKDPRNGDEIVGILSLTDASAVTSGDYERNFMESSIMYHHILETQTGKPVRATWSVTVVAKDSGLADVLSTTLFVLGPEKGLKFIEKLDGVEAFFVGADKKIYVSPGLKNKVTVHTGSRYYYDEK
ncbi:FAD:protein FMN transferase [Clostridium polyendosporum]|uniref:FAD:protein FMN transferase n=1 Tax=Clostridium polyendosporum TaxID=69208 RepID=A0A919S1T5_9CLOT|nr:FAD:protein FMN transferase [Clostridium polyendosporum]GIM29698.1 FAD:protein FMN transferase [Clostridium polyendosporum]